jgi:hypothetical protein
MAANSLIYKSLTAHSAGSLVPKTCSKPPVLQKWSQDRIRQAKADFQLMLLVPDCDQHFSYVVLDRSAQNRCGVGWAELIIGLQPGR